MTTAEAEAALREFNRGYPKLAAFLNDIAGKAISIAHSSAALLHEMRLEQILKKNRKKR